MHEVGCLSSKGRQKPVHLGAGGTQPVQSKLCWDTAGMQLVLPWAWPNFHVGVGLSLLSRVVIAEEGLRGS